MSEYDKQNEAVFEMVRQNRAVHPQGRPLRIVADDDLNAIVQRAEAAEQQLWNANKTIAALQTDLCTVRVIQFLPIAGALVTGLLVGLFL